MSFGWLGTLRQGQWRRYRTFLLNERRDAISRANYILAEVFRIGEVTVQYATQDDGTATERRTGFTVTADSSLAKLVSAYTAIGGNPLDISMFLMPDKVVRQSDGSLTSPYPSNGVVYPLSDDYVFTGNQFVQGSPSLQTFDFRRLGGRRSLDDRQVGDRIDLSRRWISQSIKYKRNDLEARIIKLCDLREQLLQELDLIAWMVSDFTPVASPNYAAGAALDQRSTATQIVGIIDRLWYNTDEANVPDFDSQSDTLGAYPNLISDLAGGWEDNTEV